MSERTRIDTATARKLAVAADADPRSVLRELRQPGSVRGMAGHRVRQALEQHGYRSRNDKPKAPP